MVLHSVTIYLLKTTAFALYTLKILRNKLYKISFTIAFKNKRAQQAPFKLITPITYTS